MKKRLIVCCDGTWQKIDSPYPTNVAKLVQAIPVSPENLLFYGEGVGTGDEADKIFGGALGWGIDKNIQEAYRFLCCNYADGDQIYLFGFSRGAYTVRSLVGLIRAAGILPRAGIRQIADAYKAYQNAKGKFSDKSESERQNTPLRDIEDLKQFRDNLQDRYQDYHKDDVEITFLGCWDTVGALGIPDQIPWLPLDLILNRRYQFHNTKLSSKVMCARHALSIDENRKEFDFTNMAPADNFPDRVKQVWFPGGHGCVGGGTKANSPLSNAALLWMMEEVEATGLGLSLDRRKIEDGVGTDPTIFCSTELGFPFTPNDRAIPATSNLHPSVQQRWQACAWYRPKSLARFASGLGDSPPVWGGALTVGQSVRFAVEAKEPENRTSIQIEQGATYVINVSPLQVWQDAQISSSVAGWKIVKSATDGKWRIEGLEPRKISLVRRKFLQLSKGVSRMPAAEWMELIVEIKGEDLTEKYRISSDFRVEFTATTSGELVAYANDAPLFYQNNQGWIFATIERIS
jgi:uncharacterized protein (DUF2235 family)